MNNQQFPNKCYDIIYADPPWSYEQKVPTSLTAATDHYATMTNDEIMDLPVADISADDSLLFMWAVSPNLDVAIEVGKAWGFDYKTVAFVWDKQLPVSGFYTMSQCELCLVFKRGKIPQPRGKRNIMQFLSCKRGRHSEKPMQIQHGITEMFPEQSKIELFARHRFPGWDSWGNEVDEQVLF